LLHTPNYVIMAMLPSNRMMKNIGMTDRSRKIEQIFRSLYIHWKGMAK
jgi:hypothetical protein